jgi:mycofactocin glycosyltransferase
MFFSVVIVTLNRRVMLMRATESVAGQDIGCGGFELIIVDGGSTDGTLKAIQSFRLRYPGIRVVVGDASGGGGIGHARNIGVGLSSGDVIAFLDDDCEASPNWLRELSAAYLNPDTLAVGVRLENADTSSMLSRYVFSHHIYLVNTLHIHPGGGIGAMMSAFRPPRNGSLVAGCGAGHSTYRRALLDEVGGFDKEMKYSEDLELNHRMLGIFGRPLMRYVEGATITHTYRRTFGGLLIQFFNYGRGGRRMRATRGEGRPAAMTVRGSRHQSLKSIVFIVASAFASRGSAVEFPQLLFVSVSAHGSLLLGEAYERIICRAAGPRSPG